MKPDLNANSVYDLFIHLYLRDSMNENRPTNNFSNLGGAEWD